MDEIILDNHHPEKIIFGWKCEWYCSWKIPNKSCWRLDITCRNLVNCDDKYVSHHNLCKEQYHIKQIWIQIDNTSESISHIY